MVKKPKSRSLSGWAIFAIVVAVLGTIIGVAVLVVKLVFDRIGGVVDRVESYIPDIPSDFG